jgi:hypothetical protein
MLCSCSTAEYFDYFLLAGVPVPVRGAHLGLSHPLWIASVVEDRGLYQTLS